MCYPLVTGQAQILFSYFIILEVKLFELKSEEKINIDNMQHTK